MKWETAEWPEASYSVLSLLQLKGSLTEMRRNFIVIFIAAVVLLVASALSFDNVNAYPPGSVTFSKDVAPIFYQKCAQCHRPGEIAPMSLLTYKDARPWAKSIREKVVDGSMPPWH